MADDKSYITDALAFYGLHPGSRVDPGSRVMQLATEFTRIASEATRVRAGEDEQLREAVGKIADYCEATHRVRGGGDVTNSIVNRLLSRVGRDLRVALSSIPPQPSEERG